ncbi:MAG: hypothetical protein LBE38_06920 [Deltaproteobacteria bacterium]|jgi:hypothetical protein|nr:hypothetical protein [Deltaproteobacteria bacterium]
MKKNKYRALQLIICIIILFSFSSCANEEENNWESMQLILDIICGGRENWGVGTHSFKNGKLILTNLDMKVTGISIMFDPRTHEPLMSHIKIDRAVISQLATPSKIRNIMEQDSWINMPLTTLMRRIEIKNFRLTRENSKEYEFYYFIQNMIFEQVELQEADDATERGPQGFINSINVRSCAYLNIELNYTSLPTEMRPASRIDMKIFSLSAKNMGFSSTIAGKTSRLYSLFSRGSDVNVDKIEYHFSDGNQYLSFKVEELQSLDTAEITELSHFTAKGLQLTFQNYNNPTIQYVSINLKETTLQNFDYTNLYLSLIDSHYSTLPSRHPFPTDFYNYAILFSQPFSLDYLDFKDLSIDFNHSYTLSIDKGTVNGPFKRGEVAQLNVDIEGLSLKFSEHRRNSAAYAAIVRKYQGNPSLNFDLSFSTSFDQSYGIYTYNIDKLNGDNLGLLKLKIVLVKLTQKYVYYLTTLPIMQPKNLRDFISNYNLGIRELSFEFTNQNLSNIILEFLALNEGVPVEELKENLISGLDNHIASFPQDTFSDESIETLRDYFSDFLDNPEALIVNIKPVRTITLALFKKLTEEEGKYFLKYLNFTISTNDNEPFVLMPST